MENRQHLTLEQIQKTPPQNKSIEVQLLCTLMNTGGSLGYQMRSLVCMGELLPEAFYQSSNQAIFKAICSLHTDGLTRQDGTQADLDSANAINVVEWLMQSKDKDIHKEIENWNLGSGMPLGQSVAVKVMGIAQGIVEEGLTVRCLGTVESLMSCVYVLNNKFNRRRLITIAQQIELSAYDSSSDIAQIVSTASDGMLALGVQSATTISTLTEVMHQGMQQIIDNQDDSTRHECILTPFTALNDTGGWNPVGLQLIVGDTGSGKSTLAMDFAVNNLRQGLKVGYVSMEMPNEEMYLRMLCSETGVPLFRLQYKKLEHEELSLVNDANSRILQYSDNLHMDSHAPESIEQLLGHLMKMQQEGCRVIYVDYLQILSWSTRDMGMMRGTTQEQLLAYVARSLHQFALRYRLLIVVLSQVNRDRDNYELTLDRIRDSKQIADAAYGVLLINRPERYHTGYTSREFSDIDPHGTVMLDQAKRRNGKTVRFIARFEAERVHFADIPDQKDAPRIGVITSEPREVQDVNVGPGTGGMDDFLSAMNQFG